MGTLRFRQDRSRYQLDYIDADGIRKRPFCPPGTTKRQAENLLREIEAGVRSGLAPRRRQLSTTTVDELCTAWTNSGKNRWTPQTREMRIRFCSRYVSSHIGSIPADFITTDQLARWLDSLPLKPSTQQALRGIIRMAWRWGLEHGMITQDPSRALKPRKVPKGIPHYLSTDEYKALLDATDGDLRDGIILSVRTGMRAGELLGLMWRDWQAGVLVVSRSLDRITGMLKVPKGRRARRVPIHPDAFEVLERRMSTRSTTMIFNIGYDAWRNQVTRALRGIGVEEGSTHLLRHTCASWWVQDGGSLMALQRLLGHATLDMTLIYAHLAPDSVEQEAAKMWGPLGTSPSSPKGIKTPSKGSERTA